MNSLTAVLACVLLSTAAVAHMGLEPPTAYPGARTIVTLRIGHDCGDETVGTTNFTMILPKYMTSVSVEQMPHWRVFIEKENGTVGGQKAYYDMLVNNPDMVPMTPGPDDDDMMMTPAPGDDEVVEYISKVTYIGFLPDHFYQLFNVRIKMPELVGAKLWFKGYQDCHNQGTSLAWESIPSASDPSPRYPARAIEIIEEPAEDSMMH